MAPSTRQLNVNRGMLAALGVLLVVGLIVLFVNNRPSSDPTVNAAPKIVSTPGHPIIIHRKSREVYERMLKQDGLPLAGNEQGPLPPGTQSDGLDH